MRAAFVFSERIWDKLMDHVEKMYSSFSFLPLFIRNG